MLHLLRCIPAVEPSLASDGFASFHCRMKKTTALVMLILIGSRMLGMLAQVGEAGDFVRVKFSCACLVSLLVGWMLIKKMVVCYTTPLLY